MNHINVSYCYLHIIILIDTLCLLHYNLHVVSLYILFDNSFSNLEVRGNRDLHDYVTYYLSHLLMVSVKHLHHMYWDS